MCSRLLLAPSADEAREAEGKKHFGVSSFFVFCLALSSQALKAHVFTRHGGSDVLDILRASSASSSREAKSKASTLGPFACVPRSSHVDKFDSV